MVDNVIAVSDSCKYIDRFWFDFQCCNGCEWQLDEILISEANTAVIA